MNTHSTSNLATFCSRGSCAQLRPSPGSNAYLELVVERLDVDPQAVFACESLLSSPEMERAKRFLNERDRRRFVVARGRLRELLAERLDTRPQSIEFFYGTHGKPELAPGGHSKLRFNISHSADLVVYAFAREGDIGVDIEEIRDIPDADEIVRRYFSSRENEAYLAIAPHERREAFFNCWTRKEAFIKALGEGLSHALDHFDVSLASDEPARLIRVGSIDGQVCGWMLRSFVPAPGFTGAVVVRECQDVPEPKA